MSFIVDSTGRTLSDHLKGEFAPNLIDIQGQGVAIMRYKPPYQRIARFDTRADAMQLVIDNLTQRQIPLNAAYLVAKNYIQMNEARFEIEDLPFTEDGDHLLREGCMWSKRILDGIPKFCQEAIDNLGDWTGLPANWSQIAVSSNTDRGRRKTQEDRMVCLPSLSVHESDTNHKEASVFAVFDGHGGSSIAAYAAAHFPFEVLAALDKFPADTDKALEEALKTLDTRIKTRCQVEPWTSVGSTAVVAIVDPRSIALRWLGDSPAFVMTSHEVSRVSTPHIPSDDGESKRVREAGGEIIYVQGELRVNGVLNLTRALGDIAGRPVISGESDAKHIDRSMQQYLLIFMCDGVSDMLPTSEIYDCIKNFVRANDVTDYDELSEHLVRRAIEAGSADNCTCVIAYLRPPEDLWRLFEEESDEDTDDDDLEPLPPVMNGK